ncbi:PAS domain-containing sensor histidine kinase [Desulfopila aestuarii]|uniref:histidine kinase n=1 Tax=Desulfopila aestuarii DSM 18488 TaxID=1121416 RepID=A0A1M7XXP5_9BACT|nr:PAS domain-containing sensor histidine kinase [Desulfopila aestuarii]SHO43481.1 PAS domain S-box-containing protein [Desulfopila aestuarii DSM 18488]
MNTDTHYLKRELYSLVQENSSIFDFLQKGSLDGLWYWDLEKPEHEWLSPQFWEILGYDPSEKKHLASEWQDIIFPEDLEVALENFHQHCADPKHPYDQIVRYTHKNGSTVWVRCRGIAIRNGAGKPIRMLGAHTDLTQFKQAEEQYHDSMTLYQDLVETSQDLIWQCDTKGRYIYLNPAWEDVFGYTIEEMLGQTFTTFQAPEYAEKDWSEFQRLMQGNTVKNWESVHIGKDSQPIHLVFNAKCVVDKEGNITGTRGTAFDISQRYFTEKKLQANKENYHNLFEKMLDGFALHEIICDASGAPVDYRFLNINPAFEKLTGLNGSDLIGRTVLQVMPATEQHWIDTYGKVALTGEAIVFENYSQELKKHFKVTAYRPAINHFACIFQDVTPIKKAEEKLRETLEFNQLVIDTSTIGLMVFKESGPCILANPAAAKIFKTSEEQLLLLDYTKMDSYKRTGILEDMETVLKSGKTLQRVVHTVNTFGKEAWFDGSLSCFEIGGEKHLLFLFNDISDKKRLEQQLVQRHAEFQAIFNSITDAIVFVDLDRRIIRVNPAFELTFGYAFQEIAGETTQFLYANHDEYFQQGKIRYNKNRHSSHPIYEIEYKRKDGTFFSAETLGVPVNDDNGQTVGFLSVIRDVTERKAADKEIKENETRYLALFNSINSGVAIYKPVDNGNDFIFVNINEAAEKISHIKKREVLGKHLLDIFPNMAKAGLLDALRQVYNSGQSLDIPEFYYSDQYRQGWRKNFIYKLPSGEVVQIYNDITERKQAEEELSRQKQLFETMFNTIPDGVVITNANREIQLANNGVKHTFGYNPDKLLGKSTTLLYANDDCYRQAGAAVFAQNSQKQSDRFITYYRKRNGVEFPAETFGAKLFDENQQWLGNLAIMRDITERLRQEEEGRVLQKQLAQAQKMEAIGVLAGGIAHDFNNILGAILGYAEMAHEDCPPDSVLAGDIEQIIVAGKRAKDLVRQIVAFSRQSEIERILIQPVIIVKEIVKLLRASLPTTIAIQHDLESKPWLIVADPTQIHQVLMNICTNAFHAMEETGGTITISLKNITLERQNIVNEKNVLPGDFVKLSIRDTGPGISPAIQAKIFDPYFTTKSVGKGTGMGLAIAHGIISSYGGFIRCNSKIGEGSVFDIFIPVADHAEAVDESESPLPTGSKNEHILFVDDEEPLAIMAKTMLERLGYHVTVRTSSLEALATFSNDPDAFDLVITDQTMPGMTGFDLARRMLQLRPLLPVILCTGFSTVISEEKVKSAGIKGFAMKPIEKKEIASLIRTVLSGPSQTD